MTPGNVKLTTMADSEFNYRLCQLASQFSSNRVDDEQRCPFLFKTYYLLNKQHVLLSVVLRNDAEINVIDHARVVKTFRDPLRGVKFLNKLLALHVTIFLRDAVN